jgi:uncharacterized membrane protein YidH (DUF202 family)
LYLWRLEIIMIEEKRGRNIAKIISVGINIIPFWGKLFISKLIAVDLIIIGILMITTGTVNVEAGKKKIKKIFQAHERSEEKK